MRAGINKPVFDLPCLGVLHLLVGFICRDPITQDLVNLLPQLAHNVLIGRGTVHQIEHPGECLGGGIASCDDEVENAVLQHVIGKRLAIVVLEVNKELQEILLRFVVAIETALADDVECSLNNDLLVPSNLLVDASPPFNQLPRSIE